MFLYIQHRSGSSEVPLVPPGCVFSPILLSLSRSVPLVVAPRYARPTTTITIALVLSLSAPVTPRLHDGTSPRPSLCGRAISCGGFATLTHRPHVAINLCGFLLVTRNGIITQYHYLIITPRYPFHPPRSFLPGG